MIFVGSSSSLAYDGGKSDSLDNLYHAIRLSVRPGRCRFPDTASTGLIDVLSLDWTVHCFPSAAAKGFRGFASCRFGACPFFEAGNRRSVNHYFLPAS